MEVLIERLRNASPMELPSLLEQVELYDQKNTLAIVDEIYKEFESSVSIVDDLIEPVFVSLIGELLSFVHFGNEEDEMLHVDRIFKQCQNFRYPEELSFDLSQECDDVISWEDSDELDIDENTDSIEDSLSENLLANMLLSVVQPLYFEIIDIAKNGVYMLKERCKRVVDYVTSSLQSAFFSIKNLIKSLISTIFHNLIGFIAKGLKSVKMLILQGIKVCKMIMSDEFKKKSSSEKTDILVKMIGSALITGAGVALGTALKAHGFPDSIADPLSGFIAGGVSALFIYKLTQYDIFCANLEKRHQKVMEVFNKRIEDIKDITSRMETAALESLRETRLRLESIETEILDNIGMNNDGVIKLAATLNVDLPYSNMDEFLRFMDED